jgi:hypothetical protein
MFRKFVFFFAILTFSSILIGCGNDRLGISGTVTIDGQPLQMGTINFRPAEGGSGNSAGAGIVDGKYEVVSDKGVKPGTYKVTIQGFRQTGRKVRDAQMGMVDETIPIAFKEANQLEVTVDSSNRTHDFELTSY